MIGGEGTLENKQEKYKMALNTNASTYLIRAITKDITNFCVICFSLEHKSKPLT